MSNPPRQYQIVGSCKQGLAKQGWSESVLRRRQEIANSDSDSSCSRSSPSPPPDALLPLPPNHYTCVLKSDNCCNKNAQNARKHSHCLNLLPKEKHDKKCRNRNLQFQLETKLYNTELEEALNSDKTNSLIHRLNSATKLLEASVHYAQCLDMKERAGFRFIELATRFINNDLNLPEGSNHCIKDFKLKKDFEQRLSEVKSNAVENIDIPDQIGQLMEDHKEKRKSYTSASYIYSDYLRRRNYCSNSQLRQLDNQYEIISKEYEYSRKILNQEIPKLINKQLKSLEHCFAQMSSIHEDFAEKDRQLALLIKEISKEIKSVHLEPPKNSSLILMQFSVWLSAVLVLLGHLHRFTQILFIVIIVFVVSGYLYRNLI